MSTLTSPVGTIVYMGLDKARENYSKTREEYTIRLLFDGNTTEGATFKQQVQAINPNKVVTTSKTLDIPKGHYIVSAWSKYKPTVYNEQKEKVDEVPYFSKGSTGQAIMTVKAFEGAKGDGLNLLEVAILDLSLVESEPQQQRESQKSLFEAIDKIKKG